MFTTTPVPTLSTATATTTTTQSPPTSPTRTSRLRGLSYLRNYTQNLHGRSESDTSSRNTRPAFPRARSQPSPDSVRNQNGATQPSTPASAGLTAPAPARRAPSPPGANPNTNTSNTNTNSNSNGWVPGGNTSDGTTRARIRQQSTSDEAPSSGPAPTVTTAESTPARTMTRSRADTAGPVLAVRNQTGPRSSSADATEQGKGNPLPSIRFIPHFDPRANRPSLSFPAVTRTLPSASSIIKVGRYSERENAPEIPANTPSSAPVGFKSKVVSRRHCEFWCQDSQWYVKDVKSSSGTFLNHVRLSPPGQESRAYAVNDGDVVQLGIDFRGGEEMIFRCVKIRIECNRGWQKHLNNFNKKTHKQLLARQKAKKDASTRDSDTASVNSSECSICLMSIAPCQSLFVAPCSHVWHYKCIRPILNGHTWPNFLCPNCRAVADLEADVDEQEDEAEWEEEDGVAEAIEASRRDDISDTGAGASGSGNHNAMVDEPEGLRTPRAMQPVRHPNADDDDDDEDLSPPEDDLSSLALHALSLTETSTRTENSSEDDSPVSEEDEHATQIDIVPETGSSSASAPRTIPAHGMLDLTPGHGLHAETVLTPRNDVGPFVLDGGAGRPAADRSGSEERRPLNGAASLDSVASGSRSS